MPANILKFPTKAARLPAGADSAIDRFREIARTSADHLILADGEPSPDMNLLHECAEALHLIRRRDRLRKEWNEAREKRRAEKGWSPLSDAEWDREQAEDHDLTQRAKAAIRRAGKMRATTYAGIYAKALLVRGSRTGAECLAMSLAEDLVALPSLRATLWPAAGEPAEGGAA